MAKLSNKEIVALEIIYQKSSEIKRRRENLNSVEEFSFSLLLLWNKIEEILKILRLIHKPEDGFPDKLDFINRNWDVLKNLYNKNPKFYILCFGKNKKSKSCLRHDRNKIAHTCFLVSQDDYAKYEEAGCCVFESLLTNLPKDHASARREVLRKKNKQKKP